ncbi:MAG: hypothetical protein F4179_06870 [Gammaproteobacteria bacterium]|nr:hypothetical protein [Gammaproteobacteria bacterium]MYF61381.1 hypothetical protein [Gammaproteobacteria bacterium]MYI22517.1 hypothetical protein [Gammaproteobacteria bacterium]
MRGFLLGAGVPVIAAVMGLAVAVSPMRTSAQQTHLVVVSGASGAAEFRERFHQWGLTVVQAAVDRHGLDPADVIWLAERPEMDPLIDGPSRRENIEAALGELSERAGPNDAVMIVLIGHGTSSGGESRFNVPGRDLSATDFAFLVERFGARNVVFVNTASASGAFISEISGPNRTVITATRSPREGNATRFAGFFADAFAGEVADTDKDERVSVLEAFAYARREVERSFEEEGLLATEHALLDDNGDGVGSGFEEEDDLDGALARTVFLSRGGGRVTDAEIAADPELAALYGQRQALEEQIAALTALRDTMDAEQYEAELEGLLVELTLTTRAIRQREGGGGR